MILHPKVNYSPGFVVLHRQATSLQSWCYQLAVLLKSNCFLKQCPSGWSQCHLHSCFQRRKSPRGWALIELRAGRAAATQAVQPVTGWINSRYSSTTLILPSVIWASSGRKFNKIKYVPLLKVCTTASQDSTGVRKACGFQGEKTSMFCHIIRGEKGKRTHPYYSKMI